MDTRRKIIEKAEELFRLYGMRSVTMDDIARGLGMSKKTIYQYFVDKDEIVTTVTEHMLQMEVHEISAIQEESESALDELHSISKCIRKNMSSLNPSILFDLQKYHAKAWQTYLEFKENVFRQTIMKTLNRGKEEGFFRQEIDPEIMAIMRIEQVQMIFDTRTFPLGKFNFVEVQTQLLQHFIYGILTGKGRQLYEEKLLAASVEK